MRFGSTLFAPGRAQTMVDTDAPRTSCETSLPLPDCSGLIPSGVSMRFLPGLMLLLPLASPFAQAELIDDVNDRGELRDRKSVV